MWRMEILDFLSKLARSEGARWRSVFGLSCCWFLILVFVVLWFFPSGLCICFIVVE